MALAPRDYRRAAAILRRTSDHVIACAPSVTRSFVDTAVLAPAGRPDEFAATLRDLLSDRERTRRLSTSALATLARWPAGRMCAEYLEPYDLACRWGREDGGA